MYPFLNAVLGRFCGIEGQICGGVT